MATRSPGCATPALAPPPAAPTNPAETLVGQIVNTCSFGVRFDVEVVEGRWLKTVGGITAQGNGMWAIAIVDVTITTTQESGEPERGNTKVRDERGREFAHQMGGAFTERPITEELGVDSPAATYRPGIARRTWMRFEVPGDVQRLTLLPAPGGYDCG